MKKTLKTQSLTAIDPPPRRCPALFIPAMAMGVLCPSLAMAQLIADDSFLTGGDPNAGEYLTPGPFRTDAKEGSPGSPDIGLVFQEPTVPGFTGEWLIANEALGEVVPFGMGVSGLASAGGMGSTDVNDHGTRFGRRLATPFTNSTAGTYYMSIVLMGNQNFWNHGYRAMELHNGGFDDGPHRRFQLGIHKREESSEFGPGDFGATDYWGYRINNSGSLIRQFPNQGVDSTEANLFVIEFVIGGQPNPANPGWNSLALLPTAEAQGNNLVFTFQRDKQAAYLNPTVEFNATLAGAWTTAQHNVNATIAVVDAGAFETVTVTIPKNGAPTLFARLVVAAPSP